MPHNSAVLLMATAAWVAFFHTAVGPDHYLPFIVLSRAHRWRMPRTLLVTTLCGIGHVLSSVVLGVAGAALGLAVEQLTGWEAVRGGWAAWLLIAFGLVYGVWGLRAALRGKPHAHRHTHDGATFHAHEHRHAGEHVHVHAHAPEGERINTTPWVLFIIFVLGPCEPLIPLVMYPALEHSWLAIPAVVAVFGLITLATMLAIVFAGARGLSLLPLGRLERYSHALAGFAILASGLAIKMLGL
jgi:sulfite exporter TauE/SafE